MKSAGGTEVQRYNCNTQCCSAWVGAVTLPGDERAQKHERRPRWRGAQEGDVKSVGEAPGNPRRPQWCSAGVYAVMLVRDACGGARETRSIETVSPMPSSSIVTVSGVALSTLKSTAALQTSFARGTPAILSSVDVFYLEALSRKTYCPLFT